jgi:hypothetical protein
MGFPQHGGQSGVQGTLHDGRNLGDDIAKSCGPGALDRKRAGVAARPL